MNYTPSNSNGYCSVDVDGINQIEIEGHDSIPIPEPGRSLDLFRARIGIYRDAQPFSQTVYFDDWKIETFPKTIKEKIMQRYMKFFYICGKMQKILLR